VRPSQLCEGVVGSTPQGHDHPHELFCLDLLNGPPAAAIGELWLNQCQARTQTSRRVYRCVIRFGFGHNPETVQRAEHGDERLADAG